MTTGAQLKAQMRIDLNRYNSREIARTPLASPAPASAQARDSEFGARAQALFAPLNKLSLRLPVVGVRTVDRSTTAGTRRATAARAFTKASTSSRRRARKSWPSSTA